MKTHNFFVLSFLILLTACSTTNETTSEQAVNSSPSENCTDITALDPSQDAAIIFSSLKGCMEEKNYSLAAELYLTGLTYGFYDTLRVEDKSAHRAIVLLLGEALSSEKKATLEKLQTEVNSLKANNTFCEKLTSLGKPDYFPMYMLKHGIEAFTGQESDSGLVEGFTPETAWTEAISKVANCE